MKPKIILVVCNGNIHRSVIAEHCLKRSLKRQELDKEFIVVSRGIQGTCGTKIPTGKNLYDYPMELSCTKPALDELGIVIPKEQEKIPIDLSVVESASVILAMEKGTLLERPNSLLKQFPRYSYKMRLFRELEGKNENVPDCFGSNDKNLHQEVVMLIDKISNECLNVLISWIDVSVEQLSENV